MVNMSREFRCCSDEESLEERVEEHKKAKVIIGPFQGDLVDGIYRSSNVIPRPKEKKEYSTQRTPGDYNLED